MTAGHKFDTCDFRVLLKWKSIKRLKGEFIYSAARGVNQPNLLRSLCQHRRGRRQNLWRRATYHTAFIVLAQGKSAK